MSTKNLSDDSEEINEEQPLLSSEIDNNSPSEDEIIGKETKDQPAFETEINEKFEEALREKEQFRALAQRAQADLVNYRRRAADEQRETRRAANTQMLLGLLPVLDDLSRGLKLIPEDAIAPGWLDGLLLVQRNLDNLLEMSGVTKMDVEGKPFEPHEHEAVLYEETTNEREGTITSVIRDGYKLYERVLRAAQVTVAKSPEPGHQSDQSDQEE